jgi:hypothetical protein
LQIEIVVCDLEDDADEVYEGNVGAVMENSSQDTNYACTEASTYSLSVRVEVAAIRRIAIRNRPPVSVE